MKKLFVLLIGIAALAAGYLMGTLNATKVISIPDAQWTNGSASAEAWRKFSVSLESAGARAFDAIDDPKERLEGIRYLSQLAAASIEMKLIKGSVVAPQFTDWMSDYRKFLGDSPDAVYHTAEISADYVYEVSGNRGDAEYLGFMLYGKQVNGWNRAVSNISAGDMNFDAKGNFSILLSKQKPTSPNQDWLKLEDDVHMIMVRQYYHGRDNKKLAQLSISNTTPSNVDKPLSEVRLSARIKAATQFFNDTVDGAIALSQMLAEGPNDIDPPRAYSADFGGIFYPTLDNEYYGSWFYLEDDEALIIEGAVPDSPYWAISLQNRWMQSLDYEQAQTALNDHQIKTKDGRYRVIVSHQQPSSGNWIDTNGKREGLLSIRYQLSKNSEKPSLKLVKFKTLQ